MRFSEICDAISNKKRIELWYDGGIRIVDPHCYGLSRTNNPVLRAYQISGYSSSGNIPDWRMFRLDQARNIKVLSETFAGPAPGYNRNDKHILRIYCQI